MAFQRDYGLDQDEPPRTTDMQSVFHVQHGIISMAYTLSMWHGAVAHFFGWRNINDLHLFLNLTLFHGADGEWGSSFGSAFSRLFCASFLRAAACPASVAAYSGLHPRLHGHRQPVRPPPTPPTHLPSIPRTAGVDLDGKRTAGRAAADAPHTWPQLVLRRTARRRPCVPPVRKGALRRLADTMSHPGLHVLKDTCAR